MSVTVSGTDRMLSVAVSGKLDSMTTDELDSVLDRITPDTNLIEFDFSMLSIYLPSAFVRSFR